MKKALIAIVVFGSSVSVQAGEQEPVLPGNNVHINLVLRQASGVLSNARNSPNSDERISCATFTTTTQHTAFCTFKMSSTLWAGCVTQDVNMISAIEALNGDDLVAVTWSKEGECTELTVQHDSAYVPKAH